jgi:hypothetical protein
MEQHPAFQGKALPHLPYLNGKKSFTINSSDTPSEGAEMLRFEEKRGVYLWVKPEDILFVKSADHYVKSVVQHGNQKKWAIRHGTLKGLLSTLTHDHFVRLNKFYMLNLNHFLRTNENQNRIYFDEEFFVAVPHRISPYVLELLKKMVYVKYNSRNSV